MFSSQSFLPVARTAKFEMFTLTSICQVFPALCAVGAGLVFRSRGMNLNLNHHPFVLKPQAMIMWVQPSLSSSQSCLSSSNCSPMTPLCPSACVIQLVVDTLSLSTCLCYSTCHGHPVKLVHKKSGSPISLLSVCWQGMAC